MTMKVPGFGVKIANPLSCDKCKNIWFVPYIFKCIKMQNFCPFCGHEHFSFIEDTEALIDYYGTEWYIRSFVCTNCITPFGIEKAEAEFRDFKYCPGCREAAQEIIESESEL